MTSPDPYAEAGRPSPLEPLLRRHLRALLGDVDAAALEPLLQHLQWVELPGGGTLMRQGEPGDAMYLLVSGRLRTLIDAGDGQFRVVRELTRGQVVGEMSLFTDEPRTATLVAVRDSVLVRLDKPAFEQLLALSPQLSVALTRQIIRRLRSQGTREALDRPVAIGLMAVSAGVDLPAFATALAEALAAHGRVAVVDAERVDAELGLPGLARGAAADATASRRIAVRLDEIAAGHDFVLLVADAGLSDWTRRCARHADELLLVADADAPPQLHAVETECLMQRPPSTDAQEVLLLLHPADRHSPSGTAAWLARRPVADHLHLRRGHAGDMARLARLQARAGIGLVLAGGGARGLAHLGVWQALHEQGVPVDVVGGTSIGAVMAALMAADRPLAETLAVAREGFSRSPTGDWQWLPLISLIKGGRMRRILAEGLGKLAGPGAGVEDLWKGCFAVATNYSQARAEVLRRGPLERALRASIAIPGALPPVVSNGDLLCDGGTFDNFPVGVMRGWRGVGTVIGVDLDGRKLRKLEFDELPGNWALLRDRLRPRAQRRYRLPSLPALLMNVTVLYSMSRQSQARREVDIYLNPPLDRVGMLQWHRFDKIVAQGHAHAVEILAQVRDKLPRAG